MRTRMHDVRPLVLAVLITMAALSGLVLKVEMSHAATYYVASNGNDSNPGTILQPLRTLDMGISKIVAGDTLYIRGGTYGIISSVDTPGFPSGTSWSNVITIAAYPGETVGIPRIEIYQPVQYVVFDGLIVNPNRGADEGIILSNGANHIRIKNCEVKYSHRQGILIAKGNGGGTSFNEVVGSNVHDNGTTPNNDHGIYIEVSNNLVEGSVIYNNAAYGVHIYGDPGEANNNIVRNNTIRNNGTLQAMGFGILLSSGTGNIAYNNLVFSNSAGILVYSTSVDGEVYNNTLYSNTSGGYTGIVIQAGSTGAIVKNNIVYLPSSISDSGTATVLSNNLTTDPHFVDLSANNFYLQATSPAIDGGQTISGVTTDFAGVPRPQGTGYEIGAYEYQTPGTFINSPTNLRVSQ